MAGIAVSLATSTAEGLVGKLVDKLISSVTGELSSLSRARGEIQYVKDELVIMSAFLRSADSRQEIDGDAKALVEQVRELAYDAQDCIDEFSLHLTPPGGRNNSSWLCLRACTHPVRSLRKLRARHQIAAEIQSIKSRVEDWCQRRSRYGITSSSEASTSDLSLARHDPRLSALYVEESLLVGIDEHRQKLVKLLLDKNKRPKLSLIAVTGAGGLGKTTIARRAYESPDVTRHFDCRAWITISQSYNSRVLLKYMIRQLIRSPPEDLDKMNWMELIEMLREHLQDESYLIVFDDLWGTTAWDSLQPALPRSDDKGSRIIITTRRSDVAEFCRNQIGGDIHEHSALSPQQSFELFCRRLFPDHTCAKELENSSRKIVEKCKGLPLAIISIAGVLAAKPKKDANEWDDMLKHLSSEMETNLNLEEMRKILDLSYNDLPYPVKRCYLYLSKYPEDYVIERKHVQRLWVAEGLASSRRDMSAEEVAESYFNEIANRFLILPFMFYSGGKVKNFRVHDVLLEMIVSKSMEENFVTPIQEHSKWIPKEMIRYLAIHSGNFSRNLRLSGLRSLTMFAHPSSTNVFSEARFLRVLDFHTHHSHTLHFIEADLHVISQLLHLKYLCFFSVARVFPKSIGNLQKLETLDITTKFSVRLPVEFLNLRELRFLFARGGRLILPRGIGRLAKLQTLALEEVDSSQFKDELHDLHMLTQVRSLDLGIWRAEPEYLERSLRGLSKSLSSLKLHSTNFFNSIRLNSVDLLFHGLQRLKLSGRVYKMPQWVFNHHGIVKLTLHGTLIRIFWREGDSVRRLGTLRNLIHLKLLEGALDAESYEHLHFEAGEFQVLKVLVIAPAYPVSFKEGALPRLESLLFRNSHRVRDYWEVLEISGIENLKNLKQIEAEPDIKIDLGKLKEAVEKFEKPPKLIIRKYTRN